MNTKWWRRLLVPAGALILLLPAGSALAEIPLLRWDLLRETHYLPRTGVAWPEDLAGFDGRVVRLEGYLMPNFGSQDPADLLVTANHPRSLFCGPIDMTAIVLVYLPDPEIGEWPTSPVEVVGTFSLSPHPGNMRPLYRLRATSWRPLKRWEQSFPDVVDEPMDGDSEP